MNIACALIHLENCSTDGMIVSSLYVYTRVCTKGDVLIAGSVRQTGGRCGPHNTSTQLLLARTWTEEQWTLDKQREDLYLDVTYSCLPYGQAIFCTPRSGFYSLALQKQFQVGIVAASRSGILNQNCELAAFPLTQRVGFIGGHQSSSSCSSDQGLVDFKCEAFCIRKWTSFDSCYGYGFYKFKIILAIIIP